MKSRVKRWYIGVTDSQGKKHHSMIPATSMNKAITTAKEIWPPTKGFTGHYVNQKYGGCYGN